MKEINEKLSEKKINVSFDKVEAKVALPDKHFFLYVNGAGTIRN